jgi:hypothetical protein
MGYRELTQPFNIKDIVFQIGFEWICNGLVIESGAEGGIESVIKISYRSARLH